MAYFNLPRRSLFLAKLPAEIKPFKGHIVNNDFCLFAPLLKNYDMLTYLPREIKSGPYLFESMKFHLTVKGDFSLMRDHAGFENDGVRDPVHLKGP